VGVLKTFDKILALGAGAMNSGIPAATAQARVNHWSPKYVSKVLSNLSKYDGEECYRISPLIQRKAFTGEFFYDAA